MYTDGLLYPFIQEHLCWMYHNGKRYNRIILDEKKNRLYLNIGVTK
jgi:hypothetical protein